MKSFNFPPIPPKSPLARECPIRDVLAGIGDRWSLLVLLNLSRGTKRFSELKREIGDVSQRMLAETLRGLEHDGFVKRRVHATVPPKVEYNLTPLGESLFEQIQSLVDWVNKSHSQIRRARKRYVPPAIAS
jgi:DNA-binding HxlR family transcriptional regulator